MTTDLRTEMIAETACVAILRLAADAAERRAAARRVAERFGFRVDDTWTTELDEVAAELGLDLEAAR